MRSHHSRARAATTAEHDKQQNGVKLVSGAHWSVILALLFDFLALLALDVPSECDTWRVGLRTVCVESRASRHVALSDLRAVLADNL